MDINIIISGAVLCIGMCLILVNVIYSKNIRNRLNAVEIKQESAEFLINEIKTLLEEQVKNFNYNENELKVWQLEHQQISQQLEHRIKVLQDQYKSLHSELDHIQQQQPEDKLYTRAQRMVALGADVNEIVKECGLPIAEAEILITMHKKKS